MTNTAFKCLIIQYILPFKGYFDRGLFLLRSPCCKSSAINKINTAICLVPLIIPLLSFFRHHIAFYFVRIHYDFQHQYNL